MIRVVALVGGILAELAAALSAGGHWPGASPVHCIGLVALGLALYGVAAAEGPSRVQR